MVAFMIVLRNWLCTCVQRHTPVALQGDLGEEGLSVELTTEIVQKPVLGGLEPQLIEYRVSDPTL